MFNKLSTLIFLIGQIYMTQRIIGMIMVRLC